MIRATHRSLAIEPDLDLACGYVAHPRVHLPDCLSQSGKLGVARVRVLRE